MNTVRPVVVPTSGLILRISALYVAGATRNLGAKNDRFMESAGSNEKDAVGPVVAGHVAASQPEHRAYSQGVLFD